MSLYLQHVHGTALIGFSDHLSADQIRVGSGDGGDPGLDLWRNAQEERFRRRRDSGGGEVSHLAERECDWRMKQINGGEEQDRW